MFKMSELESIVEHIGEDLRDLWSDINSEECSEKECLQRLLKIQSKMQEERQKYIKKHLDRLGSNVIDELMVKISAIRFLELLKAENELYALECTGVDNWCGYGQHCEFKSSDEELIKVVESYAIE